MLLCLCHTRSDYGIVGQNVKRLSAESSFWLVRVSFVTGGHTPSAPARPPADKGPQPAAPVATRNAGLDWRFHPRSGNWGASHACSAFACHNFQTAPQLAMWGQELFPVSVCAGGRCAVLRFTKRLVARGNSHFGTKPQRRINRAQTVFRWFSTSATGCEGSLTWGSRPADATTSLQPTGLRDQAVGKRWPLRELVAMTAAVQPSAADLPDVPATSTRAKSRAADCRTIPPGGSCRRPSACGSRIGTRSGAKRMNTNPRLPVRPSARSTSRTPPEMRGPPSSAS
jgi:hypothetical protein